MFFQGRQVVKSVYAGKITGMDDAHVHVADVRAMQGSVEQGVLTIQYCPFETLFAD